MTSAASEKSNAYIIKIIKFVIMMALMIGIGLLPSFGQITPMGMKILGVFIGTLFGWMTLDFIVASTLGLIFLGLSGYTTVMGAFQAGFTDTVVMNMLISFAFVGLLNELNLTGALANWILTRKFANGHPWLIVILLCFGASLVAALASTLASILLFWSIAYKIFDEVGYKRHSKEAAYILTGIIFFAAMGNYLFPFKPGVLAFSGGYVAVMGEIPQGQWYFGYFILNFLFYCVYVALGIVTKFDVAKMNIDLAKYAGDAAWGKKEKWGLFFVIFFVLFLSVPGFLPKTIPFIAKWNSMGIIGAVIIIISAAYLIQVDGKPLVTTPATLWTSGISWDLIFMIAATMPIGAAIRCEEGGIMPTILGYLMTAIGDMNWVIFTIICMVALGLLTQVSHNLIIAAVLFPVFAPICAEMGGDPLLWFIVNMFSINAAFSTPAASGWGAMLHSNSEWVSVKMAYGYGFSTLLVVWISALILIPIWTIVF